MAEAFAPVALRRPRPAHLSLPTAQPRELITFKTYASHALQEAVTHVAVSPGLPYEVAASHGFAVSLLPLRGGRMRKSFSRFRAQAYSPAFKHGGRLLAVGTGDGEVKVLNTDSGTPLRELSGHKAAVRACEFITKGNDLLTGSDDHTVRLWDVSTGSVRSTLTEAADYVRCVNSSPATSHVCITGSSDHKARLYDLRAPPKCLFTLDHSAQVDDVHLLPGGAQALTVGGLDVKVWDFFMGGALRTCVQSHSKAVTAVAIDAPRKRLVSAGLDGFVKFHDLDSLELRGTLSLRGEALMSVALSPDGKFVAAGTAAGRLEVSAPRRDVDTALKARPSAPAHRADGLAGLGRGFVADDAPTGPRPGSARYFSRGPSTAAPAGAAVVHHHGAAAVGRRRLNKYDLALRKFDYAGALDAALADSDGPVAVVSVLDELTLRGGLRAALGGRAPRDVVPLLRVVRRHIRNPAHTARLAMTLNVVLDLYAKAAGSDADFDRELASLLRVVKKEVLLGEEMTVMKGGVESLIRMTGPVA